MTGRFTHFLERSQQERYKVHNRNNPALPPKMPSSQKRGKLGLGSTRRITGLQSYLATELWPATSFHMPFWRTKVSVLSTVLARCSPRTIPS